MSPVPPPTPRGAGPDPVDLHVGARLRRRRIELRVSQDTLGEALGVSFQQVQKYELGANRISASRLVRAAAALDVPPAWFFDDLPALSDGPAGTENALAAVRGGPDAFLGRPEGAELIRLAQTLPAHQLMGLLATARALAATAPHPVREAA